MPISRSLTPAAVLSLLVFTGAGKEVAPGPLPDAVTVAWKAAGAEVGHLVDPSDEDPSPRFLKTAAESDDRPAFSWPIRAILPADGFSRLPSPQTPFALFLGGTSLTDAEAAQLIRFDKLATLDVAQTQLTAEGVQTVGRLPNLTGLTLGGLTLSDKSITAIGKLDHLQTLGLAQTRGIAGHLQPLEGMASLRQLNLTASDLDPDDLRSVGKITGLTGLYLSTTGVTDQSLDALAGLKYLRSLNLLFVGTDAGDNPYRLTDKCCPAIARLTSLENLDLCGSHVTSAGVARLNSLQSLKILDLMETSVDDAAMKTLAGLPLLAELRIGDTKVGDIGVRTLSASPALSSLWLDEESALTDAGCREFANFKSLRHLSLCNTKLSDAGFQQLAGCGSLTELDLDRSGVGDASASALARLANLKSLHVSSTNLTAAGIKTIHKAIPHCNIVQ